MRVGNSHPITYKHMYMQKFADDDPFVDFSMNAGTYPVPIKSFSCYG